MKIFKISKKIKKPDYFELGDNDEIVVGAEGNEIALNNRDIEKIMTMLSHLASKDRNLAILMFSASVTAMLNSFPDDLKTRVNSLARHLKLI